MFSWSKNSSSFSSEAAAYVENFQHKEQMEVMVINSTGRIVLTSTGCSYDENDDIKSFETAKNNGKGYAFISSKTKSGEPVTSYIRIISNRNGYAVGAIRYVVSTQNISGRIIFISAIIIFAGMLILFDFFFAVSCNGTSL